MIEKVVDYFLDEGPNPCSGEEGWKVMEMMELMLKRNGLSDPRQLLKLLQDLSTDEHVPLIARNHALRLIKQIEK